MIKHIIVDIDFNKNYLQRNCGWEGKAYDPLDSLKHRKECKILNEELLTEFIPQYDGKFMKHKPVEVY